MRKVTLFVVALAMCLIVQRATAQGSNGPATNPNRGIVRMLNHVGVVVPDMAEAINYYSEKMGYREAFRTYSADGRLGFTYMQISKDTFLELLGGAGGGAGSQPRPTGVNHYGLWVDDAKAAAPLFGMRGLIIERAYTSSHRYAPGGPEVTGAALAQMTDPYMGMIELVQPSARQQREIENWPGQSVNKGVRMLNHVAINVPNIDEAVKYYTDKLGYREGFRSYDADGRLSMVYMQISKETFIELNSNPQQPRGVTHYGLWVDDTRAAVEMFRQRGLKVSDPVMSVHRPTPGAEMMGAVLANIDDPYMGRIELVQIAPQQQRAIANWNE